MDPTVPPPLTPIQEVLQSMQAGQWYDYFRGALYPISLHQTPQPRSSSLKSLLQISADYIVRDSTMTENAIDIVPNDMCIVLMQAALEGNRDRAIDSLLTKWPLQTLCLKKYAPDIYTGLSVLHDRNELTRVSKQGLRYTTAMAHNFLETLKKKCPTKLKFIDLAGFPTAEVITYYLATHCMLAHNEARQNAMIRKYEEAIKYLPPEESTDKLEHFSSDQSLPDDYFAVKLDVFISSEPALCEIAKALKVSGFHESTLRLIVHHLDVACLGVQHLEVLLEQLNPQHLAGLRLKYNSLSSPDIVKLSPLIAKFDQLTALDLSCNTISVLNDETTTSALVGMLSQLPHLVRLDLTNSRLRGRLRQLLSCIQKPLQFLRIVACGLMFLDFSYLAVSHHTKELEELDISENGLGNSMLALKVLLTKIRSRASVLELEDVTIVNAHVDMVIDMLSHCPSLLYINLRGSSFSKANMLRIGMALATTPKLQFVCLKYPSDIYTSDDEEVQETNRKQFAAELGEVIYRERQRLNIPSKVPNLVFSTNSL